MWESEMERKWRIEREEIAAEIKKMSLKAIRAEAEDLTHQNDWSGLTGRPITKLRMLEAEFKKRTGKAFFVERRVYA